MKNLSPLSKLLAQGLAAVVIAFFWCVSAVSTIFGTTIGATTLATAVNAVTSTPAKAQRGSRGVGRSGEQTPPSENTPSVDQPPAGSGGERPVKQLKKSAAREACESKGNKWNYETGRCVKLLKKSPTTSGGAGGE